MYVYSSCWVIWMPDCAHILCVGMLVGNKRGTTTISWMHLYTANTTSKTTITSKAFVKLTKFRKNPKIQAKIGLGSHHPPTPYANIFFESRHWHGQNTQTIYQLLITSVQKKVVGLYYPQHISIGLFWDDFLFPEWDLDPPMHPLYSYIGFVRFFTFQSP